LHTRGVYEDSRLVTASYDQFTPDSGTIGPSPLVDQARRYP
jgi:hypothetical protein